MVKGISRRVIVVESPDPHIFEQAIFILSNDAAGGGISSQQVVEQAVRIAKSYARTHGAPPRRRRLTTWMAALLGGGVIVQRFGDLVRGRRSNAKRIAEGMVEPTLAATPGDLSLVLPKRILDGIIEMIYALDKIAPGTANDDTLLYGVEVKFYNMEVELDEHLESCHKGLYIIGDGSGVTHSLSHASASGVYVARQIVKGNE